MKKKKFVYSLLEAKVCKVHEIMFYHRSGSAMKIFKSYARDNTKIYSTKSFLTPPRVRVFCFVFSCTYRDRVGLTLCQPKSIVERTYTVKTNKKDQGTKRGWKRRKMTDARDWMGVCRRDKRRREKKRRRASYVDVKGKEIFLSQILSSSWIKSRSVVEMGIINAPFFFDYRNQ